MFQQLEEGHWLDEASLDMQIHRLKYRAWFSDERVWAKWLRS